MEIAPLLVRATVVSQYPSDRMKNMLAAHSKCVVPLYVLSGLNKYKLQMGILIKMNTVDREIFDVQIFAC